MATTLVANSYDMKEVCDRCGDVVRYFDTAIEYNRAQVKTAKTNLKKLKRQLQAQCEREENKSGTTQSKNPVRN
ncbi:hypothetical protein KO465_04900 [Candidatus Micrarchaeota archaeon]|nr:hypothetical protein [Candidatus Micrarchaeota archaeon]